MPVALRAAVVALASNITVSTFAIAQPTISADVGLNSQYVWRGVTSTNRFVIQPDVSIAVPVRGLTFTVGAWGNIEPAHYDGARDLSSLGGLHGPLVTQSEGWAELGGTIRGIDTSFGVEGYVYPHVGDLAQYNTVEVYGSASVEGFVSPSVTLSYDVARIRGAYVEAALSRTISGERHGALAVALTAGYNAGQAEDPRGRDLAYFDRDGLTHIDVSTSGSFSVGHVDVAPEVHVIFARDAFATVVGPDATRRTKLWFGTTLRWTNARAAR